MDVIQLGLGALQLRDSDQLPLVAAIVDWIERSLDSDGLLAYRFPMPHTFSLDPPWYSSLAQGEAGSLLVRAAELFARPELYRLADRVTEPLLQVESPLVAITPEGPVLEEYPTDPPAHVLNGWITSLFGLHDVGRTPRAATADRSAEAFGAGTKTLAARLGLYRLALGWSRYDLYPHPLTNVSSLSYQRLHVAQLRALHSLTDFPLFASTADEWERALASRTASLVGLGRKVAFRLVRPRWRRV
ncbi:MAG TPA: D-glucuronyl C5-epimerase family protein [Solirubrobacteraceae bacterium]|nr:D-glucuronyl C5-epimerase family protein [Solirubrobacteraceae bacterium]